MFIKSESKMRLFIQLHHISTKKPSFVKAWIVISLLKSVNKTLIFSCWLSDYDSPKIGFINDRISAITGLNMDTAEELQIANYGIGGQYEPHFDFARVSFKN